MFSFLKKIYNRYYEAIMYIFFGALTTLVYYIARFGSRMLLGDFEGASLVATAIAQITAITFAFVTNKKFVFKSKTESAGQLVRETVAFYAGRGVTFLLDMLITYIFVERFGEFFVGLFSLDSLNYNSKIMEISVVNKLLGTPLKVNEFIWTILSQFIILASNYAFSKLFVFRKKEIKESVK